MTALTWILGGIVLAIISAFLGNKFAGHNKVNEMQCAERRHSCTKSLEIELLAIQKSIERLQKRNDAGKNGRGNE